MFTPNGSPVQFGQGVFALRCISEDDALRHNQGNLDVALVVRLTKMGWWPPFNTGSQPNEDALPQQGNAGAIPARLTTPLCKPFPYYSKEER